MRVPRGGEIPLQSRIFANADAITSDRPYREGSSLARRRSFADARNEIVLCSGTQFDPFMVKVFLAMPDDLWSDLRREVERNSATSFGLLV